MHVPNFNHHGDRHIPNQMTPSELGMESPVPAAHPTNEEPSIHERVARLEEQIKRFGEQPTNHPATLCDFLEDGIVVETVKHGSEGDEMIGFEYSPVESTLDDNAHDPTKSDINKLEEAEKIIAEPRNENKGPLSLLKGTQDQVEASVTDSKDQIIAELRNVIAKQESERKHLINSLVEVTADANSARNNTDELSKIITWALGQVNSEDEVPWVGYEHWETANRLLLHIRSLHEKIDLLGESLSHQRYKASANQFKQQNIIQDLTTELTNTRLSKAIKSHEIKRLRNDVEQKDAKVADLNERLRDQQEEHKNNTNELNKKIEMLQDLEYKKIDSSLSSVSDKWWSKVLTDA